MTGEAGDDEEVVRVDSLGHVVLAAGHGRCPDWAVKGLHGVCAVRQVDSHDVRRSLMIDRFLFMHLSDQ